MVFYIKVSKSKKTLRKQQTKQKSSSLNVQAIKAYPPSPLELNGRWNVGTLERKV